MLFVLCNSVECSTAVRVLCGHSDDVVGYSSSYYPDGYRCPRCDGPAAGYREDALEKLPETKHLYNLEVDEMLRVQYGMGLPEEQNPTQEAISTVLREIPVRRVRGRTLKSGRFLLEELELWSGHRLFFGACPDGALVYRLSQPISHTKQALSDVE